MELKDLGVSPQTPKIFWKKFSKTFGKMQFHCIFCKSICDIFKAFPEREGGKPKVWRKGLKALQMDLQKCNEIAFYQKFY